MFIVTILHGRVRVFETNKNMAGEVVVDALPYFDQGYDEPGVRDAVSINTLWFFNSFSSLIHNGHQ